MKKILLGLFFAIQSISSYAVPIGYTELEYIENTGTQYINTGIKLTTNDGIYIKFTYDTYLNDNQILGTDISGIGNHNFYIDTYYGDFYVGDNNGEIHTPGSYTPGTYTMNINYMGDNRWYLNNSVILNQGVTINSRGYNLLLFRRGTTATSHVKIHNLIITTGNSISHNLVPVCRNSDGVLGMYDTVTNTFFTNNGTGSFNAGPSITRLPKGYTELEYIEGTGTQWIDLDVLPSELTNGMEFGIDVQYTSTIGSNYAGFGAQRFENTAGITDTWWKFDIKSQTQFGIQAGEGSSETKVSVSSTLNRHQLYMNIATAKCSVDGIEYDLHINPGIYNIPNKFGLFRSNDSPYYAYAKLYSAYIKNNGVMVRNLIPAKRNSDGAVGMYDTVSNRFFTNAGTAGDFIAGYGIASTSYVQGMYEAINNSKMAKLNPNSIEFTADSSPYGFFTAVEGAGDKFRFKREEITLPFGSYDNPTGRMSIWLE